MRVRSYPESRIVINSKVKNFSINVCAGRDRRKIRDCEWFWKKRIRENLNKFLNIFETYWSSVPLEGSFCGSRESGDSEPGWGCDAAFGWASAPVRVCGVRIERMAAFSSAAFPGWMARDFSRVRIAFFVSPSA